MLRAAESPDLIYKFHLARPPAKAEWSSTRVGNWDVTVTWDAAKCEISCAYRFKRQPTAANLLAPPVVSVRLYSDFVSIPEVVTVDPAGLSLPTVALHSAVSSNQPYIPGRKLAAAVPPRVCEGLAAASPQLQQFSVSRPAALAAATVPLRI
ncbi:hypothetical protein SBA3_3880019 [Candidatus Sulfopaludibacter sp. SbA3]|nr:hypothetical protein SBA3_3880019 [Candidatus Sulfopaludibacter sp. SbA3]